MTLNESSQRLAQVKAVKRKYERELLKKRNVVGVGIGFKEVGGQKTNQLSLIVMVKEKVPIEQLDPQDRISPEIEGTLTDVKAVGEIKALG